jgi:hypothetical protein
MKCFRCGKETDDVTDPVPAVADQDSLVEYVPAIVLDVHPDGDNGTCLAALVCWACYHDIKPDMWMEARHWMALSPKVPWDQLVKLIDDDSVVDEWDPKLYAREI